MNRGTWTSWPSREALTRAPRARPRALIGGFVWSAVLAGLLWNAFADGRFALWQIAVGLGATAGCMAIGRMFLLTTKDHRLWPSLGLLVLLTAAAFGAIEAGVGGVAVVLWCGCAVMALVRLPLVAAVPLTAVTLCAYAVVEGDGWLTTVITTGSLCLGGYVLRLDAEARGSSQRLLVQERAAREAEAGAAALAERSRIAREIHDVLAHSLSAQLVHLEAARLLIEREPSTEFRDQVLERVVSARSMARDGLAETRQALSALRGETIPVEDFLHQLVADGPAEVSVAGERRELTAEASQAVRRVAQEALTNTRKHAPGAAVSVRLEYGPDAVALLVRDSGGHRPAGELAVSGSGYGLVGMRERAELLGGTLEAGPDEEGFVVNLRVPA
ncbi:MULTISPECIES: sensor histidine kinase [Streptomyces]|uniref:histidine kinase n=1 Tax=Streptomyces glycanivorans TaxID=3033808 RepID=A0ABY9J7T7_9ACTN|nr:MULTISPECIES: histidine kinase [unclassified Streptomyces]WSQ77107.1 histidine kinase [Streptomyces sp. NBC_01213]TXS05279.1 sensor histidine kinase [Streptomyces sp. wa22]WLQ63722.1 histidine kinase [Streptomyces sp. Alt3]WSQ84439.1 histidine kinase [Streptomyces sp. NBC_01212]WSR09507.1 histidine kinase [Streptomyces sp. NBC_01208]